MILINCLICGKEKEIYPYKLKYNKGKYCSLECSYKNPINIERVRKVGLANKGRQHTEEEKIRVRLTLSGKFVGEKNWNWQGDKAGYAAIHTWLRRNLGNASRCVNGHIAKKYYWANISGEYKRDSSDYQELCNSCNMNDGIHIHPRFLGGE